MRHRSAVAVAIFLLFSTLTVRSPLSATPIGYFDGIDGNGTAFGWAVDVAVPDRSIEITLFVDTHSFSSEPAIRADAEGARPDVNADRQIVGNHGFVAMIPASFRDGKSHRLFAFATGFDGKIAELEGSPKQFQLPPLADRHLKGDGSISANGIAIATAARFGGAIASLRWNGIEFVDTQDHGREIQTAWQGNNAGECFNPTEAGSANDSIGLDTTSEVLSATLTENSITTISHPAFWLTPGQTSAFCGFNPAQQSSWEGGRALNRTLVSSSTIKKTVAIGYLDIPNVVVYDSEITLAAAELGYFPLRFIMLENPAAYLRHEFSHLYRYDPISLQLDSNAAIQPHFSEASPLPVIAATADREHAIGMYTPEIPREGFPDAPRQRFSGYTFTDWGPVVSISVHIPAMPTYGLEFAPRTYRHRTFMVIGRISDVTASLQRLALSGLSGK